MRQQRLLFDSEVQYRRVEDSEKHLSAAFDRAVRQNADLTSSLQRLRDIVMVSPATRTPLLIRPYVDDIGTAAYLTIAPTIDGGAMTYVTMETYTPNEWLSTVPGSRDLIALPPFCKRNYPPARLSMDDLLRNHRMFTSRERDPETFHKPSNANEVAEQLQHTHDLILQWRRSLPPEELLERDLQVWLGKRYGKDAARWRKSLGAQMPTARVSQSPIDAG